MVVLVVQGRTNPRDLVFAATDTVLGVLFVIVYVVTGRLKMDNRNEKEDNAGTHSSRRDWEWRTKVFHHKGHREHREERKRG